MKDSKDFLNQTEFSINKRELLAYLLEEEGIEVPQTQKISPRKNSDELPLSFSQQRLWFVDRLEPMSPAYNIPIAVRLEGLLNIAALEQSFNEIVRRHEVLRTTFQTVNEQPIQVIAPNLTLILPIIDFRQIPESERETQSLLMAVEEAQQPFDLTQGPLLRAKLLCLGEQEHVFLLTMHHIVSDGWSLGVFVRELARLYEVFSAKKSSPLPELPIQYADFALWQQQCLQGEAIETQLSYWKQQLNGNIPVLQLPTERLRPPVQTFRGARQALVLSSTLTEALKVLSQREEVTLFMTLLAAFKTLLYRYTNQDDISVGSPIANRNQVEVEDLIGLFVNTLVMRTNLSNNPTFRQLLSRVREVALGAYAHQTLPFEKLVEELQPERDLSHTPLFQVVFALQNAPMPPLELSGLTLNLIEIDSRTAKFDLTLNLWEGSKGLSGWFEYNTDLFDATTIARIAENFQTLLESIVANPEQRLLDLPLLTPAEKQLLIQWNSTQAEYPRDMCIHQLFEDQVERTPNAVAVVFENQRLSYQELNRRANQLAHYLRRVLSVMPDVCVGICMERSLEMVVSLLGILKAGGAYLPLDPAYPQERLNFMLEDAKLPVLLTQKSLIENFRESKAQVVCLDTDWEIIERESEVNPTTEVKSDNLAYVIYTSGSTGRPKGVAIEHHSTVTLLNWARETFSPENLAGVLAATSICFDLSVFELFVPLSWGGKVILAENALHLPTLTAAQEVTLINTVPSVIAELLRIGGVPASVRTVNLAGEALQNPLVQQIYQQDTIQQVFNLYGPSEDTTYSTFALVNKGDSTVTIGRPIANTYCLLLDAQMQPVPIGVPGEIYIGGASLARGYLNRPKLTAERFILNPFTNEPGDRLYKTGDLARYLPDGNIQFLGRIDYQVKLRGFRIELGEIEAVLSQHPVVRETVVVDREDLPGDKCLVAYIVANQEQALTANELRRFLKARLPEYMIPTAFELLNVLPRMPNGKVNRRALPAPDQVKFKAEGTFVAPRTAIEEVLTGIWAEVLRLEKVGIYDNFFELGGHSLLATQVISRLRKVFQVDLSLRTLFEAQTVANLAESIETVCRVEQGLQDLPMLPVSRSGALPLSFAQQRLWFLEQLEPGKPIYNISAAVRLKGHLNVVALEQSVNAIVQRHEALRTTFVVVDEHPVQIVAPYLTVVLPIVNLQDYPESQRESEVQRLITEEAERPCDLSRGPLLRTTLLCRGEEEYVLLLTMHHIVSDGWSMEVLIRELAVLYETISTGKPTPLPELPIQYADFAHWQREWLRGKVLEVQLDYWKQKLGGDLPVLQLPTDYPRLGVQTFRGVQQSLVLPKTLTELLKALSRWKGVTLFVTLLATFKTLLYRYTGQDDIIVGSPIAGRNRAEIEGLIGFFVNTLVLRTDLSGNPTFEELLHRVHEVTLGAYLHQDLPFEKLVEELQPGRDLNHTPLFRVFFNLLNFTNERLELPGVAIEEISSPLSGSKFDLTVYVREQNDEIHFALVYNADLFAQDRMIEMLEQFKHLLLQVTNKPEERITHFSLVTHTAKVLLPNPTEALNSCWEGAVHTRFSQQAQRVPERLAIKDTLEVWNYAELDSRSNQLANYLLASGIQPQEIVAVYGHRSASLVCALLGVLKAGAAFVILDPTYPTSRLIDCLCVAKPRGWLQLEAAGVLPYALKEFVATLSCCCSLELPQKIIAVADLLSHYSIKEPGVAVDPDNLAYVAFTSGTTGMPKGILGGHRPLSHFLQWHSQTFNLSESDRFSLLSGLAHDPLLRDIFMPLWLGATLCIPASEDIGSPNQMVSWMKQEEISVAHLTPAMGQLLTETTTGATIASSGSADLTSLRYVFFGGDVLTKRDVSKLRKLSPSVTCVNFYGTTETPQAMGYFIVPDQGDIVQDDGLASFKETIPLGRGIKDVQLLVLNTSQQLAGVGEVGEIYVRTPYLAKGYIGDDTLTQDRFIINPFTQIIDDRLYKTGDMGCYLPNGNIEFLGRIDHQVKIRGFRIEPREIEAILNKHPLVQDAVVIVREDVPGDKRLVAYLVANQQPAPSKSELRRFLREKLPEYAVPSVFMLLSALPLTPNGKVDRQVLPAPERTRPDLEKTFVAPRTPVEEILAEIWAKLLNVKQVGIHDNFFELGGYSLLATQLIYRVRDVFQVDLSLRCLFEAPSVAGLAFAIAQKKETDYEDPFSVLPIIEPAPEHRYLPFPLTDIQQAYWIGRSSAIELGNVASHRYIEFESAELDLERFNLAWQRLIDRHDTLRTIVLPDGQQQILEKAPLYQIEILDLREQEPQTRASQLETVRQRMSHQVLAATEWPLFEIRASRLDDHRIRLHFSFDYLIADAWSFQILIRELFQLYQNPEISFAPLELSFRDYVLAEVALQDSKLYRRSQDYWWNRLPMLPPAPELPLTQNPGSLTHPRFVGQSARLEPETWLRLKNRASQAGLTPSGVLLAAFAEILAVWSKNPRFTIVLTLFNRLPLHPQVNDIVGDFTSTTILAVDNLQQDTFEERARCIQKQLWEDLEHRYISGVQVLRELARTQGRTRSAVMPIVFTSTLNLTTAGTDTSPRTLQGDVVYRISQTPQVFLDHQVFEQDGALILNWDAVAELFPKGLLQDMFDAYYLLLQRLANDEKSWQETTPQLLPSAQLRQREAINATQAPVSAEMLHQLFAKQVRARQQQIAVISSNRTLTYQQLYCRANQVARRLRQLGACPNTLVGIVMEKGWEQVVAVLGVLHSGAAYLPIDPGLPQERLWHLLDQGEVKLVLTQPWLDKNLTWTESIQRLGIDDSDLQGIDDSPLEPVQAPEDLAYVIFTSGSTGLPKGVMIDHRGAVNTIIDINKRFNIGSQDRVLAVSSLSFDLSVYDLFGTLAAGGTIIIPNADAVQDPSHWADLITQHQVTIWNSVPTLMQMLAEYISGRFEVLPSSVRLVLLSGDWLALSLPDQVKALSKDVQVVSLGGATEASIWSILYEIKKVEYTWKSIPYGIPMMNQTFHVLNEALEPSPVWVQGNLYIGGIGLAKGYWRNEEKTRASFITHPQTGERLYHTGDLGRYLPDGNIEFLGREDFQVKLRGYRIELGEIETVLMQHPAVRAGVVTVAGKEKEENLIAYVVPNQESVPTSEELQRFLKEKLPSYMVPSTFMLLSALPLTPNAKVDRQALPAPYQESLEQERTFVAPRTPIEEVLVDIYSQVLDVKQVGIHDDFFALGGNSVRAIVLISRLRETFQVELPLRNIFEMTTVARLAEAIAQCQIEKADSEEMDQILTELEALSEEEIQKILTNEMYLN